MNDDILPKLERRLGRLHARQRLGIETDHEAHVFGYGLNFFHIENWYLGPLLIRVALKLAGLYGRARRNAERPVVARSNDKIANLPPRVRRLHHPSSQRPACRHERRRDAARVPSWSDGLRYDLCVLTGDYRGATFGAFEATLEGVARLRAHLGGPVYGVLGNHDTIQLVPGMEAMGIRMLLNECETDRARRRSASISPASTTRITSGSTTSRRRARRCRTANSRSCCRTRRRSIARRRTPASICC